jgi:predicted RNase H-like nuclease (RuvC/YqgF family)
MDPHQDQVTQVAVLNKVTSRLEALTERLYTRFEKLERALNQLERTMLNQLQTSQGALKAELTHQIEDLSDQQSEAEIRIRALEVQLKIIGAISSALFAAVLALGVALLTSQQQSRAGSSKQAFDLPPAMGDHITEVDL